MKSGEEWTYSEDADGDHAIFAANGKLVAVTVGWENSAASWSQREDAAHARLIAAAPQMLKALTNISRGLTLPEDCVQRAILKVADEAIALAVEGL